MVKEERNGGGEGRKAGGKEGVKEGGEGRMALVKGGRKNNGEGYAEERTEGRTGRTGRRRPRVQHWEGRVKPKDQAREPRHQVGIALPLFEDDVRVLVSRLLEHVYAALDAPCVVGV